VLCPSFIFIKSQIDEMFENLDAALKNLFRELAS